MTLRFETGEESGITVFDTLERHQLAIGTPDRVAPTPVSADRFRFPVGKAVAITTTRLELPNSVAVYVRNDDGEIVAEADNTAAVSLPEATYRLELTAEVKTYLCVTTPLDISADEDGKYVDFDAATEVLVGARSHHERPAATITTTSDPEDVMAAVSHLGSSLKTTTPERSYPTLRGHPPLIELGDELDVPDEIERPDTGVRIELPTELRHVFVAAPLAFYLGAEITPGDRPRLVTDDGFVYDLDGPHGFEETVERTIKQVFTFDCVTRTEGLYDIPLKERDAIESRVDLDFQALYHRSLGDRLEAYLSVAYSSVSDLVPEWKLVSHVEPAPDSVEMLPFLLDDLAIVRSPQPSQVGASSQEVAAVDAFMRDGEFTRSAGTATSTPELVDLGKQSSLEHAWVGEGAPLGTSKPIPVAFKNRLSRSPTDGNIDITVVCNDTNMSAERDVVETAYGDREGLPFDVTLHRDLTTEQLREILTEQVEFLHYIGHIDDDGFECTDGKLDAGTLDDVGVDAFFLNACTSYNQGLGLIEAGSIGGVVTMRDVINSGAVTVGSTLARLLNRGFPLRAGLSIASDESIVGNQYLVVGDGGIAIAQSESGTPILCEIEVDGDDYLLRPTGFPTCHRGMGAVFKPFIESNSNYFLNSGTVTEVEMAAENLVEFLSLEDVPVRIDGKLRWSDELDLESL